MAKNYYAILGISSHASPDDIRAAYRRLVKEFHPDCYDGTSNRFLDIQEAYSTLSESASRRQYDRRVARSRAKRPMAHSPGGRSPSPEPLIPDEASADLGEISPIRSFETFVPSVDAIFDWLWSNFRSLSYSKSERVRNLTLEVPITLRQARQGGQARILVPARATCPVCRGTGGIGPYDCTRCAGEGAIVGEYPVAISIPPGITRDHSVVIPLERFGIRNLYLTVNFRLSGADIE
jgi:molecular chaperone DnaJ